MVGKEDCHIAIAGKQQSNGYDYGIIEDRVKINNSLSFLPLSCIYLAVRGQSNGEIPHRTKLLTWATTLGQSGTPPLEDPPGMHTGTQNNSTKPSAPAPSLCCPRQDGTLNSPTGSQVHVGPHMLGGHTCCVVKGEQTAC